AWCWFDNEINAAVNEMQARAERQQALYQIGRMSSTFQQSTQEQKGCDVSNVRFHADRIGLMRQYQRSSGEIVTTVTVPGCADAHVVYIQRTIDARGGRDVVAAIRATIEANEQRIKSEKQKRRRNVWFPVEARGEDQTKTCIADPPKRPHSCDQRDRAQNH